MLTQTSTTLLNSLLEEPADQRAWRAFCDRYGPAVFRFARRQGLSEADADEVLADTLATVFEAYRAGRYDRGRGRFKTWVFGIAMNKVREFRRGRRRDGVSLEALEGRTQGEVAPPVSMDRGHPTDVESPDAEFETDLERTLAWQCLESVRTRVASLTYQAFDLYAVKERSAEDVARLLGIDIGAVYVAKSRVLSMARRQREKLAGAEHEV
jgi:RNA polymerase sigma-70 factor (ECF subfamily)